MKKQTMHQKVWKKALELAKGNVKRIEIRSPEEVVVHNHENWATPKTPDAFESNPDLVLDKTEWK